ALNGTTIIGQGLFPPPQSKTARSPKRASRRAGGPVRSARLGSRARTLAGGPGCRRGRSGGRRLVGRCRPGALRGIGALGSALGLATEELFPEQGERARDVE